MASRETRELVRRSANRRVLFLPHAIRQMARPEGMITPSEIRSVLTNGDVIEDYPKDTRGHSCLMHGPGSGGRDIHVVCAPREEFIAVITAYVPREDEWEQDLRTRRSK
ncbi:MAG: DUF4258 domain-containing protein [Gemmatimonadetes bacterium]|nr:DUF4258 domain-containing protein [Gemmatimonadota bacterium]